MPSLRKEDEDEEEGEENDKPAAACPAIWPCPHHDEAKSCVVAGVGWVRLGNVFESLEWATKRRKWKKC